MDSSNDWDAIEDPLIPNGESIYFVGAPVGDLVPPITQNNIQNRGGATEREIWKTDSPAMGVEIAEEIKKYLNATPFPCRLQFRLDNLWVGGSGLYKGQVKPFKENPRLSPFLEGFSKRWRQWVSLESSLNVHLVYSFTPPPVPTKYGNIDTVVNTISFYRLGSPDAKHKGIFFGNYKTNIVEFYRREYLKEGEWFSLGDLKSDEYKVIKRVDGTYSIVLTRRPSIIRKETDFDIRMSNLELSPVLNPSGKVFREFMDKNASISSFRVYKRTDKKGSVAFLSGDRMDVKGETYLNHVFNKNLEDNKRKAFTFLEGYEEKKTSEEVPNNSDSNGNSRKSNSNGNDAPEKKSGPQHQRVLKRTRREYDIKIGARLGAPFTLVPLNDSSQENAMSNEKELANEYLESFEKWLFEMPQQRDFKYSLGADTVVTHRKTESFSGPLIGVQVLNWEERLRYFYNFLAISFPATLVTKYNTSGEKMSFSKTGYYDPDAGATEVPAFLERNALTDQHYLGLLMTLYDMDSRYEKFLQKDEYVVFELLSEDDLDIPKGTFGNISAETLFREDTLDTEPVLDISQCTLKRRPVNAVVDIWQVMMNQHKDFLMKELQMYKEGFLVKLFVRDESPYNEKYKTVTLVKLLHESRAESLSQRSSNIGRWKSIESEAAHEMRSQFERTWRDTRPNNVMVVRDDINGLMSVYRKGKDSTYFDASKSDTSTLILNNEFDSESPIKNLLSQVKLVSIRGNVEHEIVTYKSRNKKFEVGFTQHTPDITLPEARAFYQKNFNKSEVDFKWNQFEEKLMRNAWLHFSLPNSELIYWISRNRDNIDDLRRVRFSDHHTRLEFDGRYYNRIDDKPEFLSAVDDELKRKLELWASVSGKFKVFTTFQSRPEEAGNKTPFIFSRRQTPGEERILGLGKGYASCNDWEAALKINSITPRIFLWEEDHYFFVSPDRYLYKKDGSLDLERGNVGWWNSSEPPKALFEIRELDTEECNVIIMNYGTVLSSVSKKKGKAGGVGSEEKEDPMHIEAKRKDRTNDKDGGKRDERRSPSPKNNNSNKKVRLEPGRNTPVEKNKKEKKNDKGGFSAFKLMKALVQLKENYRRQEEYNTRVRSILDREYPDDEEEERLEISMRREGLTETDVRKLRANLDILDKDATASTVEDDLHLATRTNDSLSIVEHSYPLAQSQGKSIGAPFEFTRSKVRQDRLNRFTEEYERIEQYFHNIRSVFPMTMNFLDPRDGTFKIVEKKREKQKESNVPMERNDPVLSNLLLAWANTDSPSEVVLRVTARDPFKTAFVFVKQGYVTPDYDEIWIWGIESPLLYDEKRVGRNWNLSCMGREDRALFWTKDEFFFVNHRQNTNYALEEVRNHSPELAGTDKNLEFFYKLADMDPLEEFLVCINGGGLYLKIKEGVMERLINEAKHVVRDDSPIEFHFPTEKELKEIDDYYDRMEQNKKNIGVKLFKSPTLKTGVLFGMENIQKRRYLFELSEMGKLMVREAFEENEAHVREDKGRNGTRYQPKPLFTHHLLYDYTSPVVYKARYNENDLFGADFLTVYNSSDALLLSDGKYLTATNKFLNSDGLGNSDYETLITRSEDEYAPNDLLSPIQESDAKIAQSMRRAALTRLWTADLKFYGSNSHNQTAWRWLNKRFVESDVSQPDWCSNTIPLTLALCNYAAFHKFTPHFPFTYDTVVGQIGVLDPKATYTGGIPPWAAYSIQESHARTNVFELLREIKEEYTASNFGFESQDAFSDAMVIDPTPTIKNAFTPTPRPTTTLNSLEYQKWAIAGLLFQCFSALEAYHRFFGGVYGGITLNDFWVHDSKDREKYPFGKSDESNGFPRKGRFDLSEGVSNPLVYRYGLGAYSKRTTAYASLDLGMVVLDCSSKGATLEPYQRTWWRYCNTPSAQDKNTTLLTGLNNYREKYPIEGETGKIDNRGLAGELTRIYQKQTDETYQFITSLAETLNYLFPIHPSEPNKPFYAESDVIDWMYEEAKTTSDFKTSLCTKYMHYIFLRDKSDFNVTVNKSSAKIMGDFEPVEHHFHNVVLPKAVKGFMPNGILSIVYDKV